MNGSQFWELYQSYGDVYRQEVLNEEYGEIDEANRGEQHSNLSPLQKIRNRNREYFRNTPEEQQKTTQRRFERGTERGQKKTKGAKSAFGTMRHVGGPYKESYDLYDVVLEHLLDEGYAETPEDATVLMANMSEQWFETIVEANRGEQYLIQKGAIKPGGQTARFRNLKADAHPNAHRIFYDPKNHKALQKEVKQTDADHPYITALRYLQHINSNRPGDVNKVVRAQNTVRRWKDENF